MEKTGGCVDESGMRGHHIHIIADDQIGGGLVGEARPALEWWSRAPQYRQGGLMAESDKVFAGSIPTFYDTLMVPLIFEAYAANLAELVAAYSPSSVLET